MFKTFSSINSFKGFPSSNFQQGNSAYSYSGVILWLDAAYGINTTTNNTKFSRWESKAGRVYLEQTSASAQWSWLASDTDFNNLPSISNSTYLGPRYNFSNNVGVGVNHTIAIVLKVVTLNQFPSILQGLYTILPSVNATSQGFGYYNNWYSSDQSTTSNIVVLNRNQLIINNIAKTMTGTYPPTNNFTLLGGDANLFGTLTGKIAEIIIYNRDFTPYEMTDLSNKLNMKYALY